SRSSEAGWIFPQDSPWLISASTPSTATLRASTVCDRSESPRRRWSAWPYDRLMNPKWQAKRNPRNGLREDFAPLSRPSWIARNITERSNHEDRETETHRAWRLGRVGPGGHVGGWRTLRRHACRGRRQGRVHL